MSINPEAEHLAGCPSCDVAPVVTESDGPWFVGCANPNCPLQCEVRGDTRAEAERLWNVRPEEQRLRAQRDAERAENEVIVEKLQADLASSNARAERWKARLKDRDRTRQCKHAREAARYYREVARLRAAIETHREAIYEKHAPNADFDERLWGALEGGGE